MGSLSARREVLRGQSQRICALVLAGGTSFGCAAETAEDDERVGEEDGADDDDLTPGSGGSVGAGGSGDLGTGGLGATGGAGTGGSLGEGTGGQASGGTGPCEYPEPPENVADFIEESWDAQLGGNLESREAWLLDNAILGEGKINLCVRWGATSAPSADVKQKMAPTIERWMNDWFTALGTYGCFPYPNGVEVAVTGWAVSPGNESWVSDLDDSIAVYTETDGEGEPKCPDSCSFFTNWDHEFPSCPGGEAFHTDYWIWVSDELPGSGAAAVGGDWGLRMPVSSFVERIDKQSDLVVEHEIGHGFGFQDYYDWTGATPEGGSLMIVGSTGGMQSPTVADTWLLRRAWKETQELRGW